MDAAATRSQLSHTIRLAGAPGTVFPLFEPLGEQFWTPDWQPQPIYPPTGAAATGAVFTAQGHGGVDSIWTIVRYDAQRYCLSYLMVSPGARVAWIDIDCVADGSHATLATISYTLTALGQPGHDYIARMNAAHYAEWITSWERAINHYLRHGQALAHA